MKVLVGALGLILVTVGIFFSLSVVYTQVVMTSQKNLTLLVSKAQALDENLIKLRARTRQEQLLHVPILIYHYVETVTDLNDTFRMSQNIPPGVFELQVTTLVAAGYQPVSMTELVNYYRGIQELPEKPVVLTFDDGYRDFYTVVYPILKKYGVKATVYVVSRFINSTKNYMTTQQLQELAASPLIEIGSHTLHHTDITAVSSQQTSTELAESKRELEMLTHKPVTHFAYPYGHHSSPSAKLVEQAGYVSAVTVDDGIWHTYTDRFQMKRVRPFHLTGDALLQKIR